MIRPLLALCFLAALPNANARVQVTSIGPGSPQANTRELVASRLDPLIGDAVDRSGNLVRTGDGGASFTAVAGPWGSGLLTADFCPAGACYTATATGVFVSQDGAVQFTQGGGLPAFIRDIAASATVGGEVWALLRDGSIYRSVDFASTWVAVGSMGGLVFAPPYVGVNPHPTRSGEWIVHSQDEVWHTTDSGATSTQRRPTLLGDAFILDAGLLDTNWVVLTTDTSTGLVQTEILLSQDAGFLWSQRAILSTQTFGHIRINPEDPDEFWVADYGGTFTRSTDGGLTYSYPAISTGEEPADIAFSVDPLAPFMVATEFSVGVMDPTLLEFVPAAGNSSAFPVESLAVDPRDPDHLAVIAPPSIFETFDRGQTWVDRGTPALEVEVYEGVGFDASGRLLVHNWELHRHNGTTWQTIGAFGTSSVEAFVASPSEPDTLYAAVRRFGIGAQLAHSTDGGATWSLTTFCTGCNPGTSSLDIIERPGQPARLVLLWDFGRRLEYTDDLGVTLTPLGTNGIRGGWGQSPRNGARATYWQGNTGYVSDDGLDTFSTTFSSTYGRGGTAISVEYPSYLVGVQTLGLSGNSPSLGLSLDGGLTWTPMPSWVPDANDVYAITMSADERQALVAADTGLFAIEARTRAATPFCTQSVPNSVGRLASLELMGSGALFADSARLEATGLPPYTTVLAVGADDDGFVPAAGGSLGTLCLAGQLGRFNTNIGSSTAAGAFGFELDLGALPRGAGFVPATAGSRWVFQCWYRDFDMGQPSSHFTSAVEIVWAP